MVTEESRLEALDFNQQGATLLKAGDIEGAREKLDQAIELEPMLMNSYKNYGDLYMEEKDFAQAKSMYKKALLIEKSGELYFLLGNACFMADEAHEGLENYNMAISSGFDGEDMLYFMGMAYEHLNDNQMALRYYQKACNKNPSRPDFQVKKIAAQIQLSQMDAAEESVDKLLLTSPELYDAYHLKTHLLLQKGSLKEAVAFSKSASERFPDDAELMYDYANCAAISRDYELAAKLIGQAKQLQYYADARREFLLLEAKIVAEQLDLEKAAACCKECIAMEEEGQWDGEARFLLMNLNLANKDYAGVLQNAEQLVAADQEDSFYFAALYYRAFSLKQLGREADAEKCYKEAVSLYRLITLKKPEAFEAYLYRAMCLKDIGEYDQALEILEFVSKISGDVAEVHTLRASILREMGKVAQAEEEMQKAYKIKPELEELYEASEKGDA